MRGSGVAVAYLEGYSTGINMDTLFSQSVSYFTGGHVYYPTTSQISFGLPSGDWLRAYGYLPYIPLTYAGATFYVPGPSAYITEIYAGSSQYAGTG